MAAAVAWMSDIEQAMTVARQEGKMVLLEFSRAPRCAGSVRLEAEIYPQERVASSICRHFVPVRIPTLERPDDGERFNVVWTPTLIMAEADGTERHRVVGFLPADELLAQLDLGRAKADFGRGRFQESEQAFAAVVDRYPATIAAAEADYWTGVSRYKHTRDREDLRATGERLRARYPESEWAKKGSVWLA
jgi:Thioredoxin-like domain